MKIIVTMAEESKRFEKKLFEKSLISFKNFFEFEFVFIALSEDKPTEFIEEKCSKLGINNFKIILLDSITKGQAETVYECRNLIGNDEKIIIYNIDAYFESDKLDIFCTLDCDGLIPVINSKLSIGIYYFYKFEYFIKGYEKSDSKNIESIYKYMINLGKKVKYIELDTTTNESNTLIDKYIEEKYNDNFNNSVYKLLINNENYILKFYNNERKMETEIRISNIVMGKDCEVFYKGIKDNKYYNIRKYIKGELLSDYDNLNLDISIKLGMILKQMHSIKFDNDMEIRSTKDIFLKWVKKLKESNLNLERINEVFEREIKKYDSDIAITHMDFRLGNVIITKDLELKLIDFEHAQITDKYFDFVKIRKELKKHDGLWDGFKKGYNEEINESKIDFYEFVHSVGAMSYVYSRNCEKDSFYYENFEYLNNYIKK